MPSLMLRLGTRASPLALAQAHGVRDALIAAHPAGRIDVEIVPMQTTGDRIADRPLTELGGKGLFTKEIEEALLKGTIDLAVHSAKDMATELPPGLALTHVLAREDAHDVFISSRHASLDDLPAHATVGTASLRRQALVRRLRPDVNVLPLRGNVGSRIAKLEKGAVDAIILAFAGLKRLGLTHLARQHLFPPHFLPAVGQGVIAIETRLDDQKTHAALAPIHDPPTALALQAERAFLAALDGSCRTPIAGHATVSGHILKLDGVILTPDGTRFHEGSSAGTLSAAEHLGTTLGARLKAAGGPDFFKILP